MLVDPGGVDSQPIAFMYGVFTYLHHKHQPFRWVNIPFVPWIRLGVHDFLKKVHALRKKHGLLTKSSETWSFQSQYVGWICLNTLRSTWRLLAGKSLESLLHGKINPKD